ncbi:hypothetical protein RQP46_007817 [Phenoliferia psychrophenolica]
MHCPTPTIAFALACFAAIAPVIAISEPPYVPYNSITITSPAAGVKWLAGQTYAVEWDLSRAKGVTDHFVISVIGHDFGASSKPFTITQPEKRRA